MTKFARNAARLATLGVLAGFGLLATGGAGHAVVYCKTVGYPKGCVARAGAVVVRPAPRAVVVSPRRVVYCTRVGYPVGCVVR